MTINSARNKTSKPTQNIYWMISSKYGDKLYIEAREMFGCFRGRLPSHASAVSKFLVPEKRIFGDLSFSPMNLTHSWPTHFLNAEAARYSLDSKESVTHTHRHLPPQLQVKVSSSFQRVRLTKQNSNPLNLPVYSSNEGWWIKAGMFFFFSLSC